MLENLSAMELVNSMTAKQVARLFEDGFESQNVLMITSAVKVLAKRGNYDFIGETLRKYLEAGNSIKLDSGFAIALSQIMIDIRNSCPLMGSVGRKIARRSAAAKDDLYTIQSLKDDVDAFSRENRERIQAAESMKLEQAMQPDQK